MIKVNAQDGLIGDFLGCIPAIQALAKRESVCVQYKPEVKELFEMTGLTPYDPAYHITGEITIGCTDAWNVAIPKGLHMTQAYFPLLGLDIPDKPVRAELIFKKVLGFDFYPDYILAPFSRSLPDNQKWKEWQCLVDIMPDKNFVVLGSGKDSEFFIKGDNVRGCYGSPLESVCGFMKLFSAPLISVVSGPSHLAFHLGVKNYLITNQTMNWGNNPDAVKITDPIPTLRAEKIMEVLKK